jgi:hypothetical protein
MQHPEAQHALAEHRGLEAPRAPIERGATETRARKIGDSKLCGVRLGIELCVRLGVGKEIRVYVRVSVRVRANVCVQVRVCIPI